MRLFKLNRKRDISGISGTGIIAEGVEFSDGQVVMSWLGKYHSMEIHGHGGATELVWLGIA